MQPLFVICEIFVAILMRGCVKIRASKSIVCAIDGRLLWYMIKSKGFEGFLKRECKSLNL